MKRIFFSRYVVHGIGYLWGNGKLSASGDWRFVCGSENKLPYEVKIKNCVLLKVAFQNLACWPVYVKDPVGSFMPMRCFSLHSWSRYLGEILALMKSLAKLWSVLMEQGLRWRRLFSCEELLSSWDNLKKIQRNLQETRWVRSLPGISFQSSSWFQISNYWIHYKIWRR